jgi:hypothetical protein
MPVTVRSVVVSAMMAVVAVRETVTTTKYTLEGPEEDRKDLHGRLSGLDDMDECMSA